MRYQHLIIDIEDAHRQFHYELQDMDEVVRPMFAKEVIEAVCDYGADLATSWGSIDEYIRETVDMYIANDGIERRYFTNTVTKLCKAVYDALLRSDAYTSTGTLEATFERYLGDNVLLRKMTEEEMNAFKPPQRDRGP